MNDSELESKLKAIRLPAMPEDYWANLPGRVRASLRPDRADAMPARRTSPWLVLAGGIAYACLLIGLSVWCDRHPQQDPFYALFQNERAVSKELAQWRGHLRVFMQDEHGMHHLVADQE